jgi:ATP-dependent HslUV protease ATP-binding subunit HslU
VLERLLEGVSFDASDLIEKSVLVDASYVDNNLTEFAEDEDLSRYIL